MMSAVYVYLSMEQAAAITSEGSLEVQELRSHACRPLCIIAATPAVSTHLSLFFSFVPRAPCTPDSNHSILYTFTENASPHLGRGGSAWGELTRCCVESQFTGHKRHSGPAEGNGNHEFSA